MKPISVVGSCVSSQVLKRMPGHRKTYIQNVESAENDNRFTGKISSNFTPVGNIADRLYNDMAALAYTDTGLAPQLRQDIRTQLEYVTKPITIETTLAHSKLTPNAVIYVDFTNELLPSIITQDEEFLLKLNWPTIQHYFPVWFQKVVTENIFQFDMYDKAMTIKRHHALRHAVDIINQNNQPVVILGNVYTNRVFDHMSNSVVENLSFYNDKIPFLKVDRTGQLDQTINYNYIKRQIDGFYRKCQEPKMTPGWRWVNVEEDCYADPQHDFGPHPIHLHETSCRVIGAKLEQVFDSYIGSLKTN